MQAVESVSAAFEMEGPARRAVHRLKYGRVRALAPVMSKHLASLCDGVSVDYAAPVPMHPSRQRRRGFNQAAELLAPLGFEPLPGTLERVVNTGQQVGHTMQERRRNISGAFAYSGPSLEGKTILLVDDVVTTGATVDACARVLRDYGARAVHVAAFARASYDPSKETTIDD
jgi:ComF family protein